MDDVPVHAERAAGPMLLSDIVATSAAVGATRSRKAKVAALAAALARAAPAEVETVTAYLSGVLRQRRTGLGWRSLAQLPPPADLANLEVMEVHEAFDAISALSGPGSQAARAAAVDALFGRATEAEQRWLRGVVNGEVRQGALDALMQEAVALASSVPVATVRRAAMLAGATTPVAVAALTGGEDALAGYRLQVGRPVHPMLASSAPDVHEAMRKAGGGSVAVDWKLDGIRIQVHKDGPRVLVATRTLEDITERLPEVVAVVRRLDLDRAVLDGEVIALDDAGRPRPFQDTASRRASAGGVTVTPYFFDLLAHEDDVLIDRPAAERLARLAAVIPPTHLVPRLHTDDPSDAEAFFRDALAAGQEGVVVKGLATPYEAGRRGAGWVKVKPVHTLDLVVLAVEWGSGRRRGWLSNLHLGARDPAGGFVMLGKTFKGLTDETLAWQTERFLGLETRREGHVVHVRPEQVVEIAFDGVQRSTRYPGGLALRFARVLRYRPDKGPDQADTIDEVRAFSTW